MPTARALQSADRDIQRYSPWFPQTRACSVRPRACERAGRCFSQLGQASLTPVTIRHDTPGPLLIFALV